MKVTDYSLKRLIFYFLTLGAFGFGGSVALAHAMHRDLVSKRHWVSESEFLRGLTLSQLSPGPLSALLAMYIGYIKNSILGASLAAISFILPSFVLVSSLGFFYLHYSNLTYLRAGLYGIGAAVIGIITASTYELTRKTVQKKRLLWILFLITFVFTAFYQRTNVLFFFLAGCITMIVYTREKLANPKQFLNIALIAPSISTTLPFAAPISQLFVFFFQAGLFAFGGGLAIIPFLHGGVVNQYHWLTNEQFLDAVSVAMITPGPVVIAATFIGFLVAGLPGAIVATFAIFLPVFLIIIIFTPLFTKHADNHRMVAFVEGVTAAAMGAMAGSIVLLGKESVTDALTLVLAVCALIATKWLKVPSILPVLVAGIAGIIFYHG